MRKNFVMLVGAVALIGSAASARAGAYGEAERAEEAPAAAPAVAMQVEEEVDYARTGPYIGIGGNYAIERFDERDDPLGLDRDKGIDVANSSGFHARAGYRVHPNVAVEVLYEHYSEFDTDYNNAVTSVGNGNLKGNDGHYDGWAVTANAKGYVLTGRWQPYGVLGLGYINVDSEGNQPQFAAPGGNDFVMRFGIGMDACVTEHIALGPEIAYVLPFGQANNLDMITVALGIRYKF